MFTYNNIPTVITDEKAAKCHFNMIYKDLYKIIDYYNHFVRSLPKDWIDYCQDEINKILKIFYLEDEVEKEQEVNGDN